MELGERVWTLDFEVSFLLFSALLFFDFFKLGHLYLSANPWKWKSFPKSSIPFPTSSYYYIITRSFFLSFSVYHHFLKGFEKRFGFFFFFRVSKPCPPRHTLESFPKQISSDPISTVPLIEDFQRKLPVMFFYSNNFGDPLFVEITVNLYACKLTIHAEK